MCDSMCIEIPLEKRKKDKKQFGGTELLSILLKEGKEKQQFVIPELARRLGFNEDYLIDLFENLNSSVKDQFELRPFYNESDDVQHYQIVKKRYQGYQCGNCENLCDKKCVFWNLKAEKASVNLGEEFYLSRRDKCLEEYTSCSYFSPLSLPETHANEGLGSTFVPNNSHFYKLHLIHRSTVDRHVYKELDRISSLLTQYFPEELLKKATNIIKYSLPPSESEKILLSQIIASIDLEIRANQYLSINENVYAEILEYFDITDSLVAKQRRAILRAIPDHPVRRKPVEFAYNTLWHEIFTLIRSLINYNTAKSLINECKAIFDELKGSNYHFTDKNVVARAVIYEASRRLKMTEIKENLITNWAKNPKELYNASYRLRKALKN